MKIEFSTSSNLFIVPTIILQIMSLQIEKCKVHSMYLVFGYFIVLESF
jgi:hypothetical protein